MSATGLHLDGLEVHRGAFQLGPLDIQVPAGCCLAVQGANGAGKTTLLEAVAGFTSVDAGRIVLHGRDITAHTPERRRIAYVPQDLALFPHLNVEANLAFGLRGTSRDKRTRLQQLLTDFRLDGMGRRYPRELSRGQRQRLALGRALAMEPALVLLDEPSANLDATSRQALHTGVRHLLDDHGLAVVYVTHDRSEAAILADHVAVLANGSLLQAGPYGEVLARPTDTRVAAHLGIDNLWPARVLGSPADGLRLEVAGRVLESTATAVPAGPLQAGLCAGEIELARSRPESVHNCLEVTVTGLQSAGSLLMLQLDGPPRLQAWAPAWWARDLAVGSHLWARLPADALRLVPQPPSGGDSEPAGSMTPKGSDSFENGDDRPVP
ncbi:MAG TPA: ABC transporter ATP-binding protein [Gammaproteobacteria bacterium]|nr:ABC transporter ATP-binding protein [Gammaproteobacteria bacterium]